jgi:hypothetical protein
LPGVSSGGAGAASPFDKLANSIRPIAMPEAALRRRLHPLREDDFIRLNDMPDMMTYS